MSKKIEIINAEWIKTDLLVNNEGQVPDVPKNPRTIDPEEYETLKRSLIEDPEFLGIRELVAYPLEDGMLVVLDGNMRLKALKELGFEQAPVKILPKDTSAKKMRAYVAKDNLNYGKWDDFLLSKEWDLEELRNMGLELEEPKEPEEEDKSSFEQKFMRYDDKNCSYPLVPKYDEKHQLFVILVDSEVDANWLRERLNMQRMVSYKTSKTGKSNIISFKEFKDAITENSNTESQES